MSDTDRELFEAAVSDTPLEQPAEQPEVKADDTGGQTRDERGRFASSKTEVEQPVAEAPVEQPRAEPPKAETDGTIPSWRLKEEMDARRERDRENAELRRYIATIEARLPKPEAAKVPDIFESPDGFVRHHIDPVRQELNQRVGQVQEGFSRLYATDKYGEEAVTKAYSEMERLVAAHGPNHPDYIRVMRSSHPYGELVKWHRDIETHRKIGGDLDGFLKKRDEELLSDPAFMAKVAEKLRTANGKGTAAPVVQLPPSLGRVASVASAADEPSDMTDAGLYRHAIGR